MMLSAPPSSLTRSSLEEMLDALCRRDEEEKPKDLPPALPARPTSKARLPSARRSLPNNFRVGDDDGCGSVANGISDSSRVGKEDSSKRKEEDSGFKRDIFGIKKMKKDVESPYVVKFPKDKSDRSEALSGKDAEPDGDDDVAFFTNRKLRVWCRQPSGQWGLGTIRSTSGEKVSVSFSNSNVMKVQIGDLLPANPSSLEGVDDLLQLSYSNEPSVLHNLRFRYSQDMIYTKAGPVLIALNPLKDLQLCRNDNILAYRQKLAESPHAYAVADAAYTQMLRDRTNQSIIISGESGAGKTETAKIAMQYIATLGGGSGRIENKILQTSCILEAFGNAKTSKNDNSSRFGQLIEIHFNTGEKMCGAKIETFFLEKSRVVQLSNGERSYHIFYQLCTGATSILKERLNLRMASEYKYLNQSECIAIDGVDDSGNFDRLMKALSIVQICKEDQERIFEILAAILWLGNIAFQVADKENHVEVIVDEALMNTANLMGCDSQELKVALSTHKVQCGKDTICEKLSLLQAVDSRDALAKFMYASLFNWLVQQINKTLEVGKPFIGKSISILDIYGFESFQRNSFEQFCINYANERLQQHCYRHLLKLEQEDYELDGIDWTKVSFEDNQECLDLFEKKPLGLLSLLDEESYLPKATDLTFANKLKQHLNINPCFKGERGRAFSVRHYAGEVMYDTNGFLEKNKDSLQSDYVQLLLSCNWHLLKLSATKMLHQMNANGTQKQSVGAKFKDQLFKLMHQLDRTTPHFIQCIKPNTKRLPGVYDEQLVLQQLRCGGILEVVRISRSGYPTRMTHQDFSGRYGFLLSEGNESKDPLSISVTVLQHFHIHSEMYQVGYNKVYLRAGQIDTLETRREQVMLSVLGIQKHYRGCKARQHFHYLRNGATTLQSFIRGEMMRKKYSFVVTSSLPVTWGMPEELQAIVRIQSVIRGWLVRLHAKDMHDNGKLIPECTKSRQKARGKVSDIEENSNEQNLLSALAGLQKRVLKAESALEQKEEENIALREQLRQSDKRWSDYEMKMKSMEEMWQKQMLSLQKSLAAAKKSFATDNAACQPGRIDISSPRYYDSEDAISIGSRTPSENTPVNIGRREVNGTLNTVSNLVKEFERHRQTFDEEAKALVEVKSVQAANISSDDELRRLKLRFEAWKKDYKVRLRDTKARLHKLGHSDVDKARRKWWGKFSSRIS